MLTALTYKGRRMRSYTAQCGWGCYDSFGDLWSSDRTLYIMKQNAVDDCFCMRTLWSMGSLCLYMQSTSCHDCCSQYNLKGQNRGLKAPFIYNRGIKLDCQYSLTIDKFILFSNGLDIKQQYLNKQHIVMIEFVKMSGTEVYIYASCLHSLEIFVLFLHLNNILTTKFYDMCIKQKVQKGENAVCGIMTLKGAVYSSYVKKNT